MPTVEIITETRPHATRVSVGYPLQTTTTEAEGEAHKGWIALLPLTGRIDNCVPNPNRVGVLEVRAVCHSRDHSDTDHK